MTRSVFPYLLITKHPEVGMQIGAVAKDGESFEGDGLYSFWTTHPYEKLFEVFSEPGKEFALVLVEHSFYNHAGGKLAGVMAHIN
jgi:hypothetical protein